MGLDRGIDRSGDSRLRKEGPAARAHRAHSGRRRTDRGATHRQRDRGDGHRAVEEHRRIGAGGHRSHRGLRLHGADRAAARTVPRRGDARRNHRGRDARSRRHSSGSRNAGRTPARNSRDAHRGAHARDARGETDPTTARHRAPASTGDAHRVRGAGGRSRSTSSFLSRPAVQPSRPAVVRPARSRKSV